MAKTHGHGKGGEAGHEGYDRQPEDGASTGEVKGRSREATGMKKLTHERTDMVHPGPEREEGEKSKGDAHHDQHEVEKELKHEEL